MAVIGIQRQYASRGVSYVARLYSTLAVTNTQDHLLTTNKQTKTNKQTDDLSLLIRLLFRAEIEQLREGTTGPG